MAQKLHVNYGFDYDNLKVLLGGWYAWEDASIDQPIEYPIEVGPDSSADRQRPEGIALVKAFSTLKWAD